MKSNNKKYEGIWYLEAFSYFSVNCFGLISGIVGYKKYKFSNLIYLWFISVFYSVADHSYLYFQNRIDSSHFFLSFFPILIKYHWYVNAYFIMYLFLPFINYGIQLLNENTFRNLVFFYIFFFSIYYIFSAFFNKTQYSFLINGYSSSWLTILYIIGSYFGKYKIDVINKSNHLIKCFHLINYIGFSFLSSKYFFKTGKIFIISYLSPTILFQAFSLIMLFNSINIKNKCIIKIIKSLTPLTFSATFIHLIIFSSNNKMLSSIFKSIEQINNNIFLFFSIYVLSIFLFILCIIIDYFRLILFKIMKIREACLFIEEKLPEQFDRFLNIQKIFLN